jgi:hypothetical protein
MADLAESLDDGEVAALVGEEQHSSISTIARLALADEDDFLMTDGVGRVTHCRMDVVTRESWIGVKQVRLRGTFAELAKDQFDRNPRPTDHRLSKHHERIDFDALRHSHYDQNTPEARPGFNGDLLRPLTISNVAQHPPLPAGVHFE